MGNTTYSKPGGKRPDLRIVAKNKETGEYITLIAAWRNEDGPIGARMDGRLKGISVKYEDDRGKIRTAHMAAGPDGEWWINVYEDDGTASRSTGKTTYQKSDTGKKSAAKGKGKKAAPPPEDDADDSDDSDDPAEDKIPF